MLPATRAEAKMKYGNEALSVEFIKQWVQFGALLPNPWRFDRDANPTQLEVSYWASHLPEEFEPLLETVRLLFNKRVIGRPISPQLLAEVHAILIGLVESYLDVWEHEEGRTFWGGDRLGDVARDSAQFDPLAQDSNERPDDETLH